MANEADQQFTSLSSNIIEEIQKLLWGNDIKHDVFERWTQGFQFSVDEPTALVQHSGGPCAILAPVQAFMLKNSLFSSDFKSKWRELSDSDRNQILNRSFSDIFKQCSIDSHYKLLLHQDPPAVGSADEEDELTDGQSSPKKKRFNHERFHLGLRVCEYDTEVKFHEALTVQTENYQHQYGVLLFLYSLILTKGVQRIKNEKEDPSDPLIDSVYGHGSQSLVNLLLTGKAVSNVWDNDKEVTGLVLHGIKERPLIGFLTLLEHLRYCEVGWFLKNPLYPVWLLGSETHITCLFSTDESLVNFETVQSKARRMFSNFDKEGCGFLPADSLGELLKASDLVSDPDYVKIMCEKMDPEQLGIITLNSYLEEFFPYDPHQEQTSYFNLYHYNGTQGSSVSHKVCYQEARAVLMDRPEVQIITDTSAIKTCLMTKWPNIDIKWKEEIPSMN